MEKDPAAATAGIHGEERTPQKRQPNYVNGMLWMDYAGAQWRRLPERYGPWQSVYARFAKWRDDGIWEMIFSELNVVIPPKSNAKEPWEIDHCLYKERHLVECFFQKIKWFRRVATRYDKLDRSFLAFVYMAAIMIWLL